jgi:hypothetical protein
MPVAKVFRPSPKRDPVAKVFRPSLKREKRENGEKRKKI